MILIILFKKKLINKHKMLLLRMLNKTFKKVIKKIFKKEINRMFKKEIKMERTRRVLKAGHKVALKGSINRARLLHRANKIL